MTKMFGYNRSTDEELNDVVEGTLALARVSYSKDKPADYAEKNGELLKLFGKKLTENSRHEATYEAEGLSIFKNPMVNKDATVRSNFDWVLSQVVTAIVPEVVNEAFEGYIAEIHQVGFGDTAVFDIESNDLFKVNEKAEGVRKGVDQPMFDDEFTVNTHPITID